MYGTASFHSFSDKEVAPTMGTIRELIELRIRRAIGVVAYADKEGNIVPLDLSIIFIVLKKHPEVKFPIKLENIERLYTWANAYVHSGREDYTWLPYIIEVILKTFSMGDLKAAGWSVNNGISTTQKSINEIHDELLKIKNEGLDDKKQLTLCRCEPECEIRE